MQVLSVFFIYVRIIYNNSIRCFIVALGEFHKNIKMLNILLIFSFRLSKEKRETKQSLQDENDCTIKVNIRSFDL